MERMKSATMSATELEKYIGELEEKVRTYSEEYGILRKENRSLKSTNDSLVLQLAEYKNQITDLKEENKKLKIDIEMYENAYGRMFE